MWNQTLKKSLEKLGLKPLKSDPCMFKNEAKTVYLAIYVDDGILVGKNEDDLWDVLEKLKKMFEITVDTNVKNFIGMEITHDEKGLHLSQTNYCKGVIERYNMTDAKVVDTPIVPPSSKNSSKNEMCSDTKFPYREAIGSLMYLSTKTRPDISLAVNIEARSTESPNVNDVTNVKRTLRYLKSTPDIGVFYKSNGNVDTLIVYSDSDYAGDVESRRSTTGYVCFLNGGPIAWCSPRQPIVALSSTEAEFIAAAESIKEVLYLKSLIEEMCGNQLRVVLNVDNTSAMSLIKTGKFNMRSKHIDVRYYFIVEKFNEKVFELEHCASEHQIADVFTKPLLANKFKKFRDTVCN